VRVVVCDPGVGNVRSVVRAIERAASANGRAPEVTVTRDAAVVREAAYVVVPGQGAFGAFARGIEGGLADALREHVAAGRPYLGICLGMQVLFESSEEAPGAAGLGILRGHVRRLLPGIDPITARPHALPHIGWNAVESAGGADDPPPYFYFAHTFAAVPEEPTLATGLTTYGDARFASAVTRGNVLGVQFHPEKSQREGLALLTRFFHL
jgi:imidazole glycerol-phosphate synthase subunit HisH